MQSRAHGTNLISNLSAVVSFWLFGPFPTAWCVSCRSNCTVVNTQIRAPLVYLATNDRRWLTATALERLHTRQCCTGVTAGRYPTGCPRSCDGGYVSGVHPPSPGLELGPLALTPLRAERVVRIAPAILIFEVEEEVLGGSVHRDSRSGQRALNHSSRPIDFSFPA